MVHPDSLGAKCALGRLLSPTSPFGTNSPFAALHSPATRYRDHGAIVQEGLTTGKNGSRMRDSGPGNLIAGVLLQHSQAKRSFRALPHAESLKRDTLVRKFPDTWFSSSIANVDCRSDFAVC